MTARAFLVGLLLGILGAGWLVRNLVNDELHR